MAVTTLEAMKAGSCTRVLQRNASLQSALTTDVANICHAFTIHACHQNGFGYGFHWLDRAQTMTYSFFSVFYNAVMVLKCCICCLIITQPLASNKAAKMHFIIPLSIPCVFYSLLGSLFLIRLMYLLFQPSPCYRSSRDCTKFTFMGCTVVRRSIKPSDTIGRRLC